MPYGVPPMRSSDDFPNLRQVLDERYAVLPAAAIRSHMEAAFGPGAADEYEAYLEFSFDDIGKAFSSAARDVGRFASKAAPVVANVGGGALQGAMAGSALGLPGIIAGAAVGGAGAGLSKYGSGAARNVGGILSGVTNIAGQFSPAGRVGASLGPAISGLAGGGRGGAAGAAVNALGGLLGGLSGGGAGGAAGALGGLLGGGGAGLGGAAGALGSLLGAGGAGGGASAALGALTSLFGGSSAATQLGSLLNRPEAKLALEALKLRQAPTSGPPLGRSTVPVGAAQIPVPVGGVAGLISKLAGEAAAEAIGLDGEAESVPAYMMDANGELTGDPALDRDRAARIWNILNDAQAERLLSAIIATAAPRRPLPEAADFEREAADFYDALDLAEIYTAPAEDLGGEAQWDGELVR